ncbi:hypothetical protein SAMN02745157_0097 [Kaistia soli DSM 19436]|uniref:Uncharacterized protein n=2 Tax=Kaistia TaxID=166953 RepID=A0A1M5P9M4_9HYPH|nr:hypothetical protein SAMN02745157_0097 [Kaistia soli DSM 19436]
MRYEDWTAKLNEPTPHSYKIRNGQQMLLPTAKMVDDFLRSVPKGKAVDVKMMKAQLAAANGAEVTCPVTTGYHLRTVAEAAWLQHLNGASLDAITPFWRVLNLKTPTTKRLACGMDFVASQRIAEGLDA